MSADSGNEVPNEERLEWLLSLDDDQFKRMQKVARGPVYTRRQIAKYLGTGAAAALAGGASTGAVAAQADENDNVGDVGTPSNPVDVFGDGISANSVSTDGALIGSGQASTQTRSPLIQKGAQAAYWDRSVFSNGGWTQHCIFTDNFNQISSPYRVRPDADIQFEVKFSTISSGIYLWAGFEKASGNNAERAIWVKSNGGVVNFATKQSDGQTETDITSEASWTDEQTVGIEWRSGSRATLYLGGIGGTQIGEHTSDIPDGPMIPFIEANNTGESNLTEQEQVWVTPDIFNYAAHEI